MLDNLFGKDLIKNALLPSKNSPKPLLRGLRYLIAITGFLLFFSTQGHAQVSAGFTNAPSSGCSPLVVQFSDLSTGPVSSWFWDFGNGNTSTLQNPAAVYVTPGTYTVTLTVSDGSNNDTQTQANLITVFQNPTANFNASTPTNGCAPLTVCFTDLSTPGSGAINQWLWDFGDGNNSTQQNPCHTFSLAGSYTITLVATDVNGCQNTFQITNFVNVSNTPTATFTGGPLSACDPPLTVNYTNNSSGGAAPLTYQWNFGDGNTSTQTSPSHTYTNYGAYNVTLIATDANGCADTLVRPAYVNINNIQAGFTSDTTVICEGQAINFTDTSFGGPNLWTWDFGDGGTSNQQNPSYTYNTAGTYTVSLIASNGVCGDTLVQTNYIQVDPAPTANFQADTTTACSVPLTVNFTDLSTNATAWAWDFGDGNTSNLQNPSHVYTAPGTYTVSLTVTGPNGCTNTLTINNYIVIEPPVADFVGNPLTGCVPLTVNFTDLSTSPNFNIVSWQWDFGDGNTSNQQNPTNVYTNTGVYTVSLIITNSAGCTDTLVRPQYIQVGDIPIACFSATPLQVCVGEPVNFQDCSVNATTWFWEFGDGTTSTLQNPNHVYGDTGCYTIRLTVSNFGCIDDTVISNYVCVSPPVARFNLNPAAGCAIPHTVFFTDQSILPDTWLWDFGDGNTSTLQNPVHTYTSTGVFNVTLTVQDTVTGCTDQANATVTVSIPTADFSGTPLFGCGPLTVDFTDLSTANPAAVPINQWAWDFGDGNTSNQQNPTHIYQTPGIYTVTLTVTDANGCTATQTRPAYVQVIGPDVNFGADTLAGCNPFTVNFTDSTVFGAPITSWTWDFGDGNTSNLQNPTHTYTTTGNFNVSLTVTDIDGCSRTLTFNNYILVTEPVAGFTVQDTIACQGFGIQFTDTSSGVGLSYLWDFGDGNSSTQANPSHAYTSNGTYTIQLIVTDVNGCTDTATAVNAVVIRDVLAGFQAAPTNASCPPLLVTFTDTSSFNIVSWEWDFGDGTGSVLQNPSHVYAFAGTFDVQLIVENDQGCRDTLLEPGLINIQGPNGSFVFQPDSGCTPLPVTFNATATNTASYTWDFGDGNVVITTVDSVIHTYTQTGVFNPVLILDDGLGCTFTVDPPDSIVVDTVPFPDFIVNTNLICGLDSVRFTDQTVSTRPITNWFWDFGDGNTDSVQNPVHFYNAPGNYTVTLTVINSLGCTNTISRPATVDIVDPPTAAFTPSDTIGCRPLGVVYTDQSTGGTAPVVAWDWDFGNGTSSTLQNPTNTFSNAGTFTVQLIVTDSSGCMDTTARNIVVNPGPTGAFTANTTNACPFDSITFTANSGQGIVSWNWDFGNGQSGSGNPASTVYTATGQYTVTLIVIDTLGCSDTVVRPQYINIDAPNADFTQSATSGCPPLTVTFNDNSTSSAGITTYLWDFGDGNTGSGTPVTHTYANPGTYGVTLVVIDNNGCRDTIVKPNLITVFQGPTAEFAPMDSVGCTPFTVPFTDLSSGASAAVVSWAWDFGDGNSSALQNPTHTYINPGTYTTQLIVTDANGCRDTVTHLMSSTPGPTANFIANDSVGCNPFTVTFTGNTGQGIVAWDWIFGDGNTGSGNPVTHTYTGNGNFTVTLIVTDTLGCMDTLTKADYIRINPPTANFTPDITSGCPPLAVTFTDQSTGDTTLVNWLWDFGDGNTGSGTPVTHTYQNPGTYTVTLIVEDAIGCRDTVVQTNLITVFTPPTADFGPTDTLACQPFTVEFTDSSTAGSAPVTSWQWNFGDGNTGTGNPVINGYVNPGTYPVTMIATDANGCSDTITLPYVVPDRPRANFIALDSMNCDPGPVLFVADSTDVVNYSWNFGDGNSGTGNPVTHTYTSTGYFTVQLIIEDIYGCFDTLVKPNYVFIDSLNADFLPDVRIGCPPLAVSFTDQSYSDTTIVAWNWTFGDGATSNLQNPSHTYTTSDTFTVTLIITDIIGCMDTIALPIIEVYDQTPPALIPIRMVTVVDGSSDSLSWVQSNDPQFDRYVIYRETPTGSNNFVAIDSIFNRLDTTYTDFGLNTEATHHCYRLQVVDFCGFRSPLSPIHCTMNLEAVGALNASDLSWTPYVGWGQVGSYNIYRVSNYDTTQVQFLASVPGTQTTYTDSSVACYQEYCYRIRANESGGFGEKSWSDTSCAIPLYVPNPQPPYVCAASVQNNRHVLITWDPPATTPVMMYFLEKSDDGQNWNQIGQFGTNTLQYLDTLVNVEERSYWYRLSIIDSCGDASGYSNVGRTILLEGENTTGFPFLDWNAYEEWTSGVDRYDLEVFSDLTQQWVFVDNIPGLTTEYSDSRTFLDQPIYCYRLFGYELGGNCQSLSNITCVPVGPRLYAPTGFTPNGDGNNEFFELKGLYIADYNLKIFDRWGALIFESNDLGTHWDGTWRGKKCQEGVYVWLATGRGFDGTEITLRGTATLIR